MSNFVSLETKMSIFHYFYFRWSSIHFLSRGQYLSLMPLMTSCIMRLNQVTSSDLIKLYCYEGTADSRSQICRLSQVNYFACFNSTGKRSLIVFLILDMRHWTRRLTHMLSLATDEGLQTADLPVLRRPIQRLLTAPAGPAAFRRRVHRLEAHPAGLAPADLVHHSQYC